VAAGSEQLRTWRLAYPEAWPQRVGRAAKEAGVDAELVWAVMRRESAFFPDAISRSGAQGLMQVMPATWDWLAELQEESPADPFDVAANVRYGTYYLGWLQDYFRGELQLAVASYNRGQGYIGRLFDSDEVRRDVDELLRAIDALETREYLQAVWRGYQVYQGLARLEAEGLPADAAGPGSVDARSSGVEDAEPR
jgi:soluble lytic murein transglycosylase